MRRLIDNEDDLNSGYWRARFDEDALTDQKLGCLMEHSHIRVCGLNLGPNNMY